MTLYLHEMKRSAIALAVWTAIIAFMLGVCIVIYPEMAAEMEEMTDIFSNMGAFSDAFGLDQLNFGEYVGFFATECGNTLGIGGALFAAILGISALSREERDGTAELLLTHPITRRRVVSAKLLSVITQILILNAAVMLLCTAATAAIGRAKDIPEVLLLLTPHLILQLQIACLTFGISAFMKGGALPVGIGITFGLYFVNILSKLDKSLDPLKYLTPYAYTDGGYIVKNNALEYPLILIGTAVAVIGIVSAYVKYSRKDIS